jgi:hypothetical protein
MPDAELAVLIAHLRTMQPPAARRGRGPRQRAIRLSGGKSRLGPRRIPADINIRTDDGKTSPIAKAQARRSHAPRSSQERLGRLRQRDNNRCSTPPKSITTTSGT